MSADSDRSQAAEAGTAAVAALPRLLRMYPELAAELPEALAGLARAGVVTASGAVALLERLDVAEGEARFRHGLEAEDPDQAGAADV